MKYFEYSDVGLKDDKRYDNCIHFDYEKRVFRNSLTKVRLSGYSHDIFIQKRDTVYLFVYRTFNEAVFNPKLGMSRFDTNMEISRVFGYNPTISIATMLIYRNFILENEWFCDKLIDAYDGRFSSRKSLVSSLASDVVYGGIQRAFYHVMSKDETFREWLGYARLAMETFEHEPMVYYPRLNLKSYFYKV